MQSHISNMELVELRRTVLNGNDSGCRHHKMTTIFVTGATGYIAKHIIKLALQKGYKVIGSVRTSAKGEEVKKLFNNPGFEYEVVEVLEKPGAFDNALKAHPEVTAFLHTASSVILEPLDPEKETLIPAVEGTKYAIRAVHHHGRNVKHFVLTSSYVANVNFSDLEKTITEDTWNNVSWNDAIANPSVAYPASKAYGEKAAWEFLEMEKPTFSLTCVNPSYVLGPQAYDENAKGKLNISAEFISGLLNLKQGDKIPQTNGPFIDVRDVAKAHLAAIENDKFASQRLLLAGSFFSQQLALNVINKQFPDLHLPVGDPDSALNGKDVGHSKYNNSKTKNLLGYDFISLETCVHDLVKQYLENRE